MRYGYFQPAADLRPLVGSYYILETPEAVGDIVRAEIAHVRMVLGGESTLQHGARRVRFAAPVTVLCGPSLGAGHAAVSAGSVVVGASLTPLGWRRMIGVPMSALADRKVPIAEVCPADPAPFEARVLAAASDGERLEAFDDFFRSLIDEARAADEAFIAAATAWLLDPDSPGIAALSARTGLSGRQLNRLCKAYFGAPPKRLQRTFRVLQASDRLAVSESSDWRAGAGVGYYDQAHFIKDFKEIIGCTPGEFIRGPHLMIRFDLEKRREITHRSRLSLIG